MTEAAMAVQADTLAGVPVLVCHAGEPARAAARATLVLYHGVGVDARTMLPEAARLVAAGFLVVAVDNVGHGRRWHPTVQTRLATPHSRTTAFLGAVRDTAWELPALADALAERGWLRRLGLVGVSMGGYIVYAGVVSEPRVEVAVAFIANPRWQLDWPVSPHRHPDAFAGVALLSLTAGHDEVVPPAGARDFHAMLAERFADADSRLAYREYPDSGHTMLPADWEDAWDRALAWCRRWLATDV